MQLIIRLRNFLLATAAISVLAAIPVSERLKFDQRIESFFAEDNPDLKFLQRSRNDFGGDEFVVVAWTEDRLFGLDPNTPYPSTLEAVLEEDFLPVLSEDAERHVLEAVDQLHKVPGVNADRTQHLGSLLDSAPRYKPARRSMLKLFEGTLVGQDGRTTGIMLELQPEADAGVPRGETLRRIRSIAAEMSGDVAVAGEPVQVFDMFEMVEQDGQILFLVSLGILSVVLWLMFRRVRWVLTSVGLVLGSVVITRAILQLSGAELSMVSSMLSSLVTVIGIATCMHVIVHYRDLRQQADPETMNRQAIACQTLSDMAWPIFWTCLTTAVGFSSLLVSDITPVRSFAVMMTLATGVILAGCFVVLPASLASGSRIREPAQVPLEHWLDRALAATVHSVERHPVLTALTCGILFLGSLPGILRLTIETDFSRNFRESSDIVRSLKFIERKLGGAGSWEVSFDTPETLTDEFLNDIQKLTERLREVTAADDSIRILSLTDVSDLPPRVAGPAKTLARLAVKQPEIVSGFYNEAAQRMRIILRSAEQQPSEHKAEQVRAIRESVTEFLTGRNRSLRELRHRLRECLSCWQK
ncbi:MAG: MMPL family transporter [Planctomycetaceae bacterium]